MGAVARFILFNNYTNNNIFKMIRNIHIAIFVLLPFLSWPVPGANGFKIKAPAAGVYYPQGPRPSAPVVPAPAYRGDEVETRDARAHPYDPYATVPVDATYKEEKLPPQPLKKAVQILTQQSKISQDTPEVAADATYKGDRKARGYTLPQAPPSAPVVPAPAYKIKAPAAAAEPYKVHEEVKKARQ